MITNIANFIHHEVLKKKTCCKSIENVMNRKFNVLSLAIDFITCDRIFLILSFVEMLKTLSHL